MRINATLAMGATILALGGFLYWQVKANGTLEQAKAQAEQSLKDVIESAEKARAKAEKTNQQLKATQEKYDQLNRYARGLRNDLRSQNDECTNTAIPDAVAERVRQYRAASKGGENP